MALLNGRRWPVVGLAVALGVLLSEGVVRTQSEPTESEVKAAFLYNFAKYVEWPATAFDADGTFRLCVLADSGFLKNVDAIIAGESIDGRQVTRHTPTEAEAARACQILFVGRAQFDRAAPFLLAVQRSPVLTVSDAPDFLNRGGTIVLVRDAERIRFDVNMAEAQRSGLSISSRLLRVARHVSPISQGR